MTTVQRICDKCGAGGPLTARYCPSCGHDGQAEEGEAARDLPTQRSNLPVVLGKAALPLLAGAASLALRAGWKLLQTRLANTTPEEAASALQKLTKLAPTTSSPTTAAKPVQPPARATRRTVHIRSSWAVGDSNGNWQRGTSEHTIEFDD